jgi:hypothetical protein
MKIEIREFKFEKYLLLIPENEVESKQVDFVMGERIPTIIVGSVELEDGYGAHYIRLHKAI